jgi:hypothetical protein
MEPSDKTSRFVDVTSDLLSRGYGVRFRAGGDSMTPAIGDGDLITVKPMTADRLGPGRVVLYRRHHRVFAHRIVQTATSADGRIVLRGDAARMCDEPVAPSQVLGEVVAVTPRPTSNARFALVRGGLRRAAASLLLAIGTLAMILTVPTVASAAILQQVQSGTATNNAAGTQTITISAIDTTKSFLIFQVRSTGDRPVNSTVRGRIASSTTIQFDRSTNEGAPLAVNIQWYVATFGSGVSVQRGEAVMNQFTVNVPITAVGSMNRAFVIWSMTPNATENEVGSDDIIAGDLTSTTNLQFRTNDMSGHNVSWQVVEFTNSADINVQRGTVTTLTGATLSTTATLGTAVDVSRTFILAGGRTDGSGPDVGARMFRAQLTNSTTLTFDRGAAGSPDNFTEISWQAVELKDGSLVTRGTSNFAVGATTATVTFTSRVNTTRAIAFGSVQAGGQSMGRSPYVANDVMGVATATMALSPSDLTLTRDSTLDSADIGWFVIQFAGGDAFKVGSFTKATGGAPASQTIPHGLGQVPKALILWTEGRTDESFSTSSGISPHGAASASALSGVTTLSIPVPGGTVAGDFMLASVGFRPNTLTVTAPAGWTLIRRMNNTTGAPNSLAVYYRIATSGEPASYTWTFSAGAAGAAGGIQSFGGVDLTDPFDVENGATTPSGLTHTAPSVVTTNANSMVVTTHSVASGTTWTPPGGMTEAYDISVNAVPDAFGISISGNYALQAAAGATGTKTATAANDPDSGNTHTIALNPAPAGAAYFGFGMTDGTRSRSVSTSSQNGVTTSNASTRIANKVLTMVRWGEVVVAEADLSSWDDTNFTLNWTTNDANAYVVHFIALGGSDLQAKVVDWTMPTAIGNKAVTGVGFMPDVVFHMHGGHTFTAAAPANQAGGAFGLGVMDADGDQWALANWTVDNLGTSDTQRGQLTTASVYSFNNALAVQKRGAWVSMDADGFTLNFDNTASNAAARVFSLALKGVNVKPGSFLKSTGAAPAAQQINGTGFKPTLVMLASTQTTTQANPVAHARFGFGASDGSVEGSSAVQDEDAAAFANVGAIDKTSKVFVKVDNGTPAIDAEADFTSFHSDGFNLSWTTNDAVQTEILYLTLAPLAVTEVRLISFTASRESEGVHLAWRTGYEVSNLGFHLYREIDGQRTRITKSLVAGSGLTVGSRTRVTSEQSYSYWDRDSRAGSPKAVYWLEDVDYNGKSTWHGPVTPGAAAATPPPVENSPLIGGLGRGVGYREERFTATREPEIDANKNASASEQSARRARSVSAGIVAAPVTLAEARERQWAIASLPAVKIGVRVAGWYRVTQPTLVAAGLDPQADPSTLRLFLEGIEQPIVVTGSGDGHFDAGDAIEFYGTGIDTPATDTAVYWLTAGTGTGLRVQVQPATPRGPDAPARFWGAVERKDRSVYFAALRNGDAENWFGDLTSDGEPVDVNVTVRHPDPAAPSAALLEVALQGVTVSAEPVNHQVRVRVNGTVVGDVLFQGRSIGTATLTVPHNLLLEGANVVQFETLGGEADMSLFSSLRLNYWHTTQADDNELPLNADAGQTVAITELTGANPRVVDITNPEGVIALDVTPGCVPNSIDVQTPGDGTRTLLVFTDLTIKTPLFVSANQPSSLHTAGQSYNYLVVTHPSMATQLAPLVAHRASQGYQAALVSIDDIYDEFSFGARSPQALKDFFARARATWTVKPRYIVLAGDATFDPRDYAGLGFGDFVPTGFVDMAEIELETASDDWLVDGNDDGLPDVAIGRLPVRTPMQASSLVSKIVAYDAEPVGAWTKNVAMITDTDDPTVRFRASSAAVAARVPSGFQINRLDRDLIGVPALRSSLFDAVNQGQLIVNYLGHGSTYIWGSSGELLATADLSGNWAPTGARLPFVVAMNCLNGYFHGIYGEESLAERMLRGGGAVAVWASSSLTEAEPQSVMDEELFRLIFRAQGTLGDVITAAKGGTGNGDVRRSWIFFGDPATKLRGLPIVEEPPPTLAAMPGSLNFAVVTSGGTTTTSPSQTVRLVQTGNGTVTWTATADQPWIQITNGTGTGSGHFQVSLAQTGLPTSGSAMGTVTIATGGAQNSPSVTVNLSVISSASKPPFGTVDTPLPGATGMNGAIAVTGWVLDDVAVSKVQIFRDAVSPEPAGLVYVGDAVFIAGARPDVEGVYSSLPFSNRAGWGFMLLTNMLPNQGNGTYTVHVQASDVDGHQVWLGSRTFTVDNAHATTPFGTIDTPLMGQVVSGTIANFGWTLTQQPKLVPFDGSTITVLIDGVAVGHPGPLSARSDIQALFPGYANTDNAVSAFILDTTQYADGLHTIIWVVTDNESHTAGIGSRYFTIDNAGGGSPVLASVQQSSVPAPRLIDVGAPVRARTGYDVDAPLENVPLRGRTRRIVAHELEHIEIAVAPEQAIVDGTQYEGYQVVNGMRRALPVGSTLDAATGLFTWQPGVGFLGTYQLRFVRTAPDGRVDQVAVEIVLQPQHPNGSDVRLSIDVPASGDVETTFALAGWAIDRSANEGTGVDAVHVWAYPNPGSGAPPIFLGTATLGVTRTDVGAAYGPRYANGGYELVVQGLASGTYDLAVFPHSTVTGQFDAAAVVRVTVR